MKKTHTISWLEILLVVAIALVSAVLRFYLVDQVPPGLNSDEAVGAVGALETLRNGIRLHYAGQGASGAIGFYIEALAFALFGPSVASVRGTTAFAGVVSVIATYFLTREMFRIPFGETTTTRQTLNRARLLAAVAAVGLAVSLWHVRGSRMAFAAIGVPFLQIPSNYLLWRGMHTRHWFNFALSGLFLALVAGIYMSGAAAPLIYAAFFLLQWGIVALLPNKNQPVLLKEHFRNIMICAGVSVLLFLPMVYFYLSRPELATSRAQQTIFTNPLINHGDPWGTLIHSFWGNLAAFGLSLSWFGGNPPGNLLFPVPLAILFVIGFGISLARIRRPPYLFLLISWALMLVPSIITPDSIPHPLRALGAAPFAYMLAAIGVLGLVELGLWLWNFISARVAYQPAPGVTEPPAWSRPVVTAGVLVLVMLLVAQPSYREFRYYFVDWPKTNDAQAAFHVYAVDLGRDMSQENDPQATFLLPRDTAAGDINPNYTVMFFYQGQAGYAWIVDDENSIEDELNQAVADRDVVHVVRWKTSKHTGADPKEITRYYLEKHGRYVSTQEYEYYDIDTYQLDELGPDLTESPLTSVSLRFGDEVTLLGYAFGDASGSIGVNEAAVPAGDLLWVHMRFNLAQPTSEDLKVSVTVKDKNGHTVGQIDKQMFNNIYHKGTREWAPDTQTDIYFLIPMAPATPPGDYDLGVAVYGADTQNRLAPPSGTPERIQVLGEVAIRPDLVAPQVDTLQLAAPIEQPRIDGLRLIGYQANGDGFRPGQDASLSLVWQAQAVLDRDYEVSLWFVSDKEGQSWVFSQAAPLAGIDFPTPIWANGQIVRGILDGKLPPDMPNGDYQLRARILEKNETEWDDILLGTVPVQGWPRQYDVPDIQNQLQADFGGQVELLGFDAAAYDAQSGSIDVTLYWRALSTMGRDLTTFIHILDETGQVLSQVDHTPGNGTYPTTGWLPQEIISDKFTLPLNVEQASAARQVEIGIYDSLTMQRLPVLEAGSPSGQDRVLIPIPSMGGQD